MQALLYNLIMVTTPMFMGQYASLESCNNAIRAIYEKQLIPNPSLIPKNEMANAQKSVDIKFQYQHEYVCVPVT